jgi:hypothetical protein
MWPSQVSPQLVISPTVPLEQADLKGPVGGAEEGR